MTILLVGGGSGGHIMPLLAVARKLKAQKPNCRVVYVGERKGKFFDIAKDSGVFDDCHMIFAGKLRRYHGESLLKRITDFKTIFLNVRDLLFLAIGFVQSLLLMQRIHPQITLLKGGFVCVPVGLSARLRGTPIITHDSDATASLSNRIAGKGALYHAVAVESPYYPYPTDRIRVVGVPANPEYAKHKNPTDSLLKKYQLKRNQPILLVTGGSQGSRRINKAVIDLLPKLVKKYPDIHIFHHVGATNTDQYELLDQKIKRQVTAFTFSDKLYEMSALATVIVTRAGATTIAEFGSQGKACIIIPHSELAGDHQTKNAEALQTTQAVIVVNERQMIDTPDLLFTRIADVIDNDKLRNDLRHNLLALQPRVPATDALADLIIRALPPQDYLVNKADGGPDD